MTEFPPDDDLTPFAVPLDEPEPEPTEAPVPLPAATLSADAAPEPEPPRLSLFSREVPGIEFQPRLRTDR